MNTDKSLAKRTSRIEQAFMLLARILAATFFLASMPISSVVAGSLYKFEVIAKTGQAGITGIQDSPSINDFGLVAFSGSLAGGTSIFVADGTADPKNITPGFVSPNRSFSRSVKINNNYQVLSQELVTGPLTLIRLWDGTKTNTFTTLVRGQSGKPPGYDYDAVFSFPSVNNNNQVVFSALDGAQSLLVTKSLIGYDEVPFSGLVRPMIADDGHIIVKIGSAANDPIRLYQKDLSLVATVANSTMFTVLGRSPGISGDGRIIVFYGDLTAAAATVLNTTPGPGIFARINMPCITAGPNGVLDSAPNADDTITSLGISSGPNGKCETVSIGDDILRVPVGSSSLSTVQRIAGIAGNGFLDPGEEFIDTNGNGRFDSGIDSDFGPLQSFSPDTRVSANTVGTISYLAFSSFGGKKGLYTSLIDFISADEAKPLPFAVTSVPTLVAEQGSSIPGVGEVGDLAVNDPLNNQTPGNRGEVVFWVVSSSAQHAVVRAAPLCLSSDYTSPSVNPYIHQYAAGVAVGLPIDSHGKAGGNACGPSSLTMLINSFKFANGQAKRLPLILTDDYSGPPMKSVYGMTMVAPPVDNANNLFDWAKGLAFARSVLAFPSATLFVQKHPTTPRTVNHLLAFIDHSLSNGWPVLVSTSFSTKIRASANPFGGGHVILLSGRTLAGDYIVKDPAGNYFAGDNDKAEHYGLLGTDVKSCGGNVIYPRDTLKLNLAKRSKAGALTKYVNSWTLKEGPTANLDEAAPRTALAIPPSSSADPDGFLVIGRFSGPGPSPYQLWVEDANGKRTGWLASGDKIEEIPDSLADVDPILPSSPDAPSDDVVDSESWPYMVSVNNAPSTLKVFVYGNQSTNFSVEIVRYQGGQMTADIASGTVEAGKIKVVEISPVVTVPNVIGRPEADARAALTAAGVVVAVTADSSTTVPVGVVITQAPLPGVRVAKGSTVKLVVSSGPALVSMPNLVGLPQAGAEASLKAAGLKLGVVSSQTSGTVSSGSVISQKPAQGQLVAAGSQVDLVISSGGLPGDVNGDGKVDCIDLAIIKASFGKRSGQPGFDARADVNKNGVVDIRDLSFVSQKLPVGSHCP